MKLTASDIARLAEGTLRGDGALHISGAAQLDKAGPSDLSFLADPALAAAASGSKAGCLLVPTGSDEQFKDFTGTLIFTKNPKYAFMLALRLVEKEKRPLPAPGVHPSAVVAASALVGKEVHIGPLAVIEDGAEISDKAVIGAQCYVGRNAKVGREARLYPGVKIMDGCEIGAEAILHAGVVIGSDGYGYLSPRGAHEKIPQLGRVVVEGRVEIGANTTIDRAALDITLIGGGTKIDNLVHIAHNVKVGKHCLIMAEAGIAGSVVLGDNVIIGGQAAISDHVTIGENSVVMGKTGVMSNLPANQIVFGHLARPRLLAMKIEALLGKLPEMHKAIHKIQKKLGMQ
ncbi:MAG: UDP-3-O-(3-hydroxymyristoyl)glucosamine N-acyltransferase [Elusimicrobia bacterium RIFCSPLOWO2_02_FULL_61_11]|nr:MAG: UDP-3-O-(3-hydroxymyristoyl)glucosamine N-acyltransferase [Elusimicrobia bacterium RIFCSPLOWO2_02_FULL_61_11]